MFKNTRNFLSDSFWFEIPNLTLISGNPMGLQFASAINFTFYCQSYLKLQEHSSILQSYRSKMCFIVGPSIRETTIGIQEFEKRQTSDESVMGVIDGKWIDNNRPLEIGRWVLGSFMSACSISRLKLQLCAMTFSWAAWWLKL